MTTIPDPAALLRSAPRVALAAAQVVLMPHAQGPVMVHGVCADEMLDPLYARRGESLDAACAWVLDGGQAVLAVRMAAPVALDLVVVPEIDPAERPGLVRRERIITSLYPDEEARATAMADFRIGGVRGDWERLGLHLPVAGSAPLRG